VTESLIKSCISVPQSDHSVLCPETSSCLHTTHLLLSDISPDPVEVKSTFEPLPRFMPNDLPARLTCSPPRCEICVLHKTIRPASSTQIYYVNRTVWFKNKLLLSEFSPTFHYIEQIRHIWICHEGEVAKTVPITTVIQVLPNV